LKSRLIKRLLISTCLWFGLLSVSTPLVALAQDSEIFINKLKSHYHDTRSITAFSITYRYLGKSDAYQSWDYQSPSRYIAFKVTEMDLTKKHYVQNVVHHFTGGRLLDEVHFQNDHESLRYEKNGLTLGKRVSKQKMDSFERYKNLIMMNIDFFAVRPLLEEANPSSNIKYHHDAASKETTLTHAMEGDKEMQYVFAHNPIRLLSINNKARRRVYIFDDYQTFNGVTYARSLIKYYNGDNLPSYINQIDNFEAIEKVNTEKLQLPSGYGPLIPTYDKGLTSTEISANLYLITDASANRNTLLKVIGDEIILFGAASNKKRSVEIIKLVTEKFPEKTIASVYVTHPYSDQISGLESFAQVGATILADEYTIEAIKAYPRFKKTLMNLKFQIIKNNELLNGVRFYVLENSRSKRQSFAYFEGTGILYQTEFLEVAIDNTIAKILPNYSKAFIDFVNKKHLEVSRIVGHKHNNNISKATMNKYYDTNTM